MLQKTDRFPAWAEELRDIFRGGTVSQFILYGNVYDVVPYRGADGMKFYSLREFLADVLFAPFDCVLYYNRGAGIKALRGKEEFQKFLKMMDEWTQSSFAGGALPRDPNGAMDLFDRFIHYSKQRTLIRDGQPTIVPLRVALIIDFVQFIVPAGDYVGDRQSEMLIRMLDWASDPGLLASEAITLLVTENLSDVARNLVENPYNAKLRLPLPTEEETVEFVEGLRAQYPELETSAEVPLDLMARKLVGLTRVNIQHMVAQAIRNNKPITEEYLTKLKKELIEKACYGLLDFIESKTTLDHVAGQDAIKTWLKEDAKLIRQQAFACLPMGYLMTGRIGTGKTWLANCWAGEVGVPFVAFKNFRDKWQGATEGNLEKIFTVLHALGQVIVFVDEADQMTGKRGGGDDSGVSGRIYAMLAREMSDTRNRGRIIWIFATSRPDLLEVDLKRPGRLDVHIPIFPPQSSEERQALFGAMAKKVGLPLKSGDLPKLPEHVDLGGNEMEALMVRAMRVHSLQTDTTTRPLSDILSDIIAQYRPLPHVRNLEYMDLIAVKECTDTSFLPDRFKALAPEELETRLDELKRLLHIE